MAFHLLEMLNLLQQVWKRYIMLTLWTFTVVLLDWSPSCLRYKCACDKILLDAHVTSDKVWFRSVFSVQPETLCIEPDEEWQH